MKPVRICFWTPGHAPTDDGAVLGCASHGMIAGDGRWIEPEENTREFWVETPAGKLFSGSFAEIVAQVKSLSFTPSGLLVLLAHGESSAEVFLHRLVRLLPGIPMIGGVAARRAGETRGELRPAGEAAILTLTEHGFEFFSGSLHDQAGPPLPCSIRERRTVEGGMAVYERFRQRLKVPDRDFESFTFADASGCNRHFYIENDTLRAGADLPEDGLLLPRFIPAGQAQPRFERVCTCPKSLILGCAGLRGLLQPPVATGRDSLTAFLFGEIVTLPDKSPALANLMLTSLSPKLILTSA